MGHYGGNEHPYYFNEYLEMIREGKFTQLKVQVPRSAHFPMSLTVFENECN